MSLESSYKTGLKERIERLFPGCLILKNDAELRPGILDMLILWREHWAMLEVKRSANAREQPNQRWYVETLDDMSFAAFIYPENEEEVLHDLQQAFGARRNPRISKR